MSETVNETDDQMADPTPVEVHEYVVLEKFEGEETTQEALIERIHIENGEIIKRETWENGTQVSSEDVKEVT
jgi:hypothetical protein